ncbi:MAG: hypothetical protein U5K28_12285 [Halobacteriales archaeon]|nr:hypothetical protein [Halobacteriales archaeon]
MNKTATSNTGSEVLHHQAVRIPLPDVEAERVCHKNMWRIAAAGERKIQLLADPDVPVMEAYEDELDNVRRSFKHRLQQLAGKDYDDVAAAYRNGERDDWIGMLAAYYLECYLRLQERYTVNEQISVLVLLRYPACFTVNLSFFNADVSTDAVRFESMKHGAADLDDQYREQYYADCQYSQKIGADRLQERIDCIRDAFPDPDVVPFEQRRYGGFVQITGRTGSTFMEILDAVSPDPDRFDDNASTPGLVPAGPEFQRVKRELLIDAEVAV